MTTTQTTHTTGTWTVQREELEYSPEGMYLKGLVIATEDAAIAHLIEWQAPLEAEANARLIASAPALLAALKALHQANAETFEGLPNYDALWDAAAKAIAQAEGEG